MATVRVENKIENMPLSIAYNSFISENSDADKYAFLDDDTELNQEYIDRLVDGFSDYDVELPKIIASEDRGVHYPVEFDVPVLELRRVDPRGAISIGSGLILTKGFVQKFSAKNKTLFNNNYALYGVDFSLFRNARKLLSKGMGFSYTSTVSLNHSLSRLQKGKISEHTKRERLYDTIISARHYPSLGYMKELVKAILVAVKHGQLPLACHIIATYVKGYHPRCEPYLKRK
jgi:hypothetical protein